MKPNISRTVAMFFFISNKNYLNERLFNSWGCVTVKIDMSFCSIGLQWLALGSFFGLFSFRVPVNITGGRAGIFIDDSGYGACRAISMILSHIWYFRCWRSGALLLRCGSW
jgi:hypothetical protein